MIAASFPVSRLRIARLRASRLRLSLGFFSGNTLFEPVNLDRHWEGPPIGMGFRSKSIVRTVTYEQNSGAARRSSTAPVHSRGARGCREHP